jgi:L-aminopeptidase/D-esterase-like protein
VGKLQGLERASPGGVGSASVSSGEHTVAALAVVNALGEVLGEDGSVLVGARAPSEEAEGEGSGEGPSRGFLPPDPPVGTNTTLVVVATDAPLSRVDLSRLARMASGAFSRAIRPVNTPFDGDILFALSPSRRVEPVAPGELLALGEAAGAMAEEAIRRGVSEERRAGG